MKVGSFKKTTGLIC
ncbi:hypothetical protein [Enterococcus faecalis]